MVALSSIETKYVVITITAKEATWIRLLFIEINLLNKKGQYTEIKVLKDSKGVE